jgi:hypothetical protein
MADKHIDILKSLKNCHIKPPSNLFKKIWRVLKMSNVDAQNSSFGVTDLSGHNITNSSDDEHTANEIEIFRSLQNYIIVPPAFSALKISDTVQNSAGIYPVRKSASIIRLKYFGRVAAAVLIIGCGIWIYTNKRNLKNESVAVNVSSTNVLPGSNNSMLANNESIKSKSDNNKTSKVVPEKSALIAKADKHNRIKLTGNLRKANSTGVFNSREKLVDNDILLTLVSYNYTDYMPLLSEIKKNNKIKLDQFSYVTISDKMNEVLKKMYATKRNNKPTRKAKRLRAKIEKWKKSDEKYFDSNSSNNPTDVIDLSEFIFK